MDSGLGSTPSVLGLSELVRKLEPYLGRLAHLLASPRYGFTMLLKDQVPQTSGLYVIYREEPLETLYVGKAICRNKPLAKSDGLRFRIMENHLGKRGNDNFVRYVKEAFSFDSRSAACEWIRTQCSVHWLVVSDDARTLFVLEHLGIAATQPRFNRG